MASLAVLAPSPLLRAGLAALLRTMGFDPVEEAADVRELKRRASDARRPEMLLIGLPQKEELAGLMHEIKAWAPQVKVVFLAPHLDMPALSACFAAGGAGYLLEDISRDGLQHSLLLVGGGENVFPSELANALSASASELGGPIKTTDELRNLHATELDILRRVANGDSNSFIGRKLGLSEAEVSAHMKHILRKLRVSNRTQAALWGVARGLAASRAALSQLAETEVEELPLNPQRRPSSQKH
jgi:two-component system nitrate/nitrite response regulator NarL